ncbi:MAG: apolipoprotein N-acyltransferase [Elusimicrobiota bacterium]
MSRPITHLAVVLLSSLLYILAFPNFNGAGVAWVALVPLLLFTFRLSPRQAFWSGWLTGLLTYSGLLYWILVTFRAAHQSLLLAVFSLLALAAYLGVYWGLWTYFAARARSVVARELWPLACAAAWVALEYGRTYFLSGFPWTLLGDSQYRTLPFLQLVSITGVYGLSFLIVLVNATLVLVLHDYRQGHALKIRVALLPAVLLWACFIFGNHRLASAPAITNPAPGIRVALLQGSIDQYKKWDKAYIQEIETTYEHLVREASDHHAQLVIWPETSVPGYLLQDPPLLNWLLRVVRQSGTTHLVGAPVAHEGRSYNSAFMLDPTGAWGGEYAKQHLVPFGEVVPFKNVLGRWISVLNELGGFTAGRMSPVLAANGCLIGVNICYEALFPNLVRRSVCQGAEVIANLTNDGWYMKTAAPYQHFAPNVLRAVENSRWLVRADNTGVSAIVDPYGRIQAASPIFESTIIEGTVQPLRSFTLYTRFGDWLPWLCLLFCGLISLRAILRR